MCPRSHTLTYSRVVHLSHVIDTNIPNWPGDPPVELETVAQLSKDGYYLRRFSMGEHSATHINAPLSFHPGAHSIDAYEAGSLIIPAVVIDLPPKIADDADRSLCIADMEAWEAVHGPIPDGSLVLVRTRWDQRWADPESYVNLDDAGHPHFPGIDPVAARHMVEVREAAGLGIDSPGVDVAKDTSYETNKLVLSQQHIVLENLTNLDQLPATGATVVIGILRLRDGSGSPASVLALLP